MTTKKRRWDWFSIISYLAIAIFLGGCGWGWYRFKEQAPQRTHVMAIQTDQLTEMVIAQARKERLEAKPPVPQTTACRPLPAKIDREGLSFWGFDDDQKKIVQYRRYTPSSYSDQERYRMWQWVNRYAQLSKASHASPRILGAGPLKERLEAARSRILNHPSVPCAYEWRAIQGIVASQPEALILSDVGEADPLAEYNGGPQAASIYQQAKRIPSSQAEKEDELTLALRMVDNATSLVFSRSMNIRTGYGPGILEAFRTLCLPFNVSYVAQEEAAILWNRGRFLQSVRHLMTEETEFAYRRDLKMMDQVDRGSNDLIIQRMTDQVRAAKSVYADMVAQTPKDLACEYPPDKGEGGSKPASSVSIDALNDPIVNFMQSAISEQSKLAFGIL